MGSRNIRMAPIPILGTTSFNRSFTEWEVGILGWLQWYLYTSDNACRILWGMTNDH
jgi:hypothetical protein